jgi:hypothetical protein
MMYKEMNMVEKTLYELIVEALEEAKMLEMGVAEPDEDHMLLTAMRLSGAPYSFVEQVYQKGA